MSDDETFWTCGDGEILTHTDVHDAVIEHIDDALCGAPESEWPETVTVHGYVRDVMSDRTKSNLAEIVLDRALEYLDDDHGPIDEPTEITAEMREAAEEFVKNLVENYRVWRCTEVTKVEVALIDFKDGN